MACWKTVVPQRSVELKISRVASIYFFVFVSITEECGGGGGGGGTWQGEF